MSNGLDRIKKEIERLWRELEPEIKERVTNVWKERGKFQALEKQLENAETDILSLLHDLPRLHRFDRTSVEYGQTVHYIAFLIHHIESSETWVETIRAEMNKAIEELERIERELEEELKQPIEQLNLQEAKHRFTYLYQWVMANLQPAFVNDYRNELGGNNINLALIEDKSYITQWFKEKLGKLDIMIEWVAASGVINILYWHH